MIFDTSRLMGIHFQLKMIIYDLKKSRKKIKYFCDAGPKSDARGDEKQGIYSVWPNEMKLSKSKANYMIFTDYIRFSRIDNLDKPP